MGGVGFRKKGENTHKARRSSSSRREDSHTKKTGLLVKLSGVKKVNIVPLRIQPPKDLRWSFLNTF